MLTFLKYLCFIAILPLGVLSSGQLSAYIQIMLKCCHLLHAYADIEIKYV